MSSPASGAIALQMLRVLEHYPAATWADDLPLAVHRLAETQRFAFAHRASLGDPAFVKERNVLEYEDGFLTDESVERVFHSIQDNTTQRPKSYFLDGEDQARAVRESHGTSHISVADASGMAASLTTTINLIFGAQIMEPKTGIILYVYTFPS